MTRERRLILIRSAAAGSGKTFLAAVLPHIFPSMSIVPVEIRANMANLEAESIPPFLANAPVIIVADGSRDDLYPSLYGTVGLASGSNIRGIVVNKFRGDKGNLKRFEEIVGVPILGVLPEFDGADGLFPPLDVAAPVLPGAADYADSAALAGHPAFFVRFVADEKELGNPDLILVPRRTRTKEAPLLASVDRLAEKGTPVVDWGEGGAMREKRIAKGEAGRLTGTFSCLSGCDLTGCVVDADCAGDGELLSGGAVEGTVLRTGVGGMFRLAPICDRLAEELLRRKGWDEGEVRALAPLLKDCFAPDFARFIDRD